MFEFIETKIPRSIALGHFDGVHIGHQRLLEALENDQDLRRTVLTFSNHPLDVLCPSKAPKSLSDATEKTELLKKYGAQEVIMPPFNQKTANMTAEDFLLTLFETLKARRVVIGNNYRFGAGAVGDIDLLKNAALKYNADCIVVPDVLFDDEMVSSTRIRNALRNGEIEKANHMLARAYSLHGIVKKGRQIGRMMDFPTANIEIDLTRVLPMDGVYSGFTMLDNAKRLCVINIGASPTVHTLLRTVEVHVIGFHGELYGTQMNVHFTSFLRQECHFDSLDALKAQIACDVERTLRMAKFGK